MFSKLWKVFKEVAIGILLVLSLWLVIGGAYKKDIGNLSDWISAACNILMAAAALFAANEARKWFHQKTSLNNLDAAHKLALEFENALWAINSRLYFDTVLRRMILNWIETDSKSFDDIYKIALTEFDKNTGSDLEELAFIYNCQARLERFNVYPSQALVELLSRIKTEREEYLDAHYTYLFELAKHSKNKNTNPIPSIEQVDNKKRKLGATFEFELAKRDIGKDYFFL